LEQKSTKFWLENLAETDHFGGQDVAVDMRITYILWWPWQRFQFLNRKCF